MNAPTKRFPLAIRNNGEASTVSSMPLPSSIHFVLIVTSRIEFDAGVEKNEIGLHEKRKELDPPVKKVELGSPFFKL